jgi:DNA polymerase III psi subunit
MANLKIVCVMNDEILEILPIYTENLYRNEENIKLPEIIFGDENADILIIIQESENNSGAIDLIRKILAACKLNLETVQCVFFAEDSNPFPALNQSSAGIIIIFDATMTNGHYTLMAPYYKVIAFKNKKIILSDSLAALENNAQLKGKLWNSLKELFKLS